jgi:hypothetical protein
MKQIQTLTDNRSLVHLQPQKYGTLLGGAQVLGAQATGGAGGTGCPYTS